MALTDAKIRAAKPTDKAYKLTDGASMFLLVHPNGSRYWRLRYRILGKENRRGCVSEFLLSPKLVQNRMSPKTDFGGLTAGTEELKVVSLILF